MYANQFSLVLQQHKVLYIENSTDWHDSALKHEHAYYLRHISTTNLY